jgi:hypothetical protein
MMKRGNPPSVLQERMLRFNALVWVLLLGTAFGSSFGLHRGSIGLVTPLARPADLPAGKPMHRQMIADERLGAGMLRLRGGDGETTSEAAPEGSDTQKVASTMFDRLKENQSMNP